MHATGYWFASGSSTRSEAEFSCIGDRYELSVEGKVLREGTVHGLSVSDRVGNVARKVYFEDGALFETTNNDALDELLARSRHSGRHSGVLHRIEKSWRWVVASLVITVVAVFSVFKWGLPFAASRIAHSLPVSVHETISTGTLATLDKLVLEPSNLSEAKREEIQMRFETLAASLPDTGFDFELHFRAMRMGGKEVPNAFALPDGSVVVTDGLTDLVEDPHELDSVLLHEIGHVVERHGMQHVIQASTIAVIVSLALGDASGLGELATGAPVFLLQSSYSRKSESSADEFAFERMAALGIDPKHFATIIMKLDGGGRDTAPDAEREDSVPEYISTHPDSARRAERALEASEAYRKKGPQE